MFLIPKHSQNANSNNCAKIGFFFTAFSRTILYPWELAKLKTKYFHFIPLCIPLTDFSSYFMFTYSAVRLHKQVRCEIISRKVDISEEYVMFTQPTVIFRSLIWIWGQDMLRIREQTFLKSHPVVFSAEPWGKCFWFSRCTISFVTQRSGGVGLEERRNYGPLKLHWEGSCIFK